MFEVPKYPWAITTDALENTYDTNLKEGIETSKKEERSTFFGKNELILDSGSSVIEIVAHQFKNPLIVVLLFATLLTLILGEWFDAGIIFFAVLINTALGFFQEYKAERAIADLRSYITERARVVRNGREEEIDSRDIVPGDIIHLVRGARVTADARLIKVSGLGVDEAILTGEALPVTKHTGILPETAVLAERGNMVFAGTHVVDGSAYALVTHIGYQTELGALAQLTEEIESEKTPLQVAIGKLAWVITVSASLIVLCIFVLGISKAEPLYDMLLLSIAIIVGAVPEALPIGLTAVLAIGVERIAKRNGIMRSLSAAETLGSTTLVMTDKTGTLTQAKMELVDITPFDKLFATSSFENTPRKRYSIVQKEILRLAACNSDVVIEDDTVPPAMWVMSGSPLEINIVRAAGMHGIRFTERDREAATIRLLFNSTHKFSVSKIPTHFLPGAYAQFEDAHVVVGAPDILLARSYMDKEVYLRALEAVERMSNAGRRVIGVALVTPHTNEEVLHPEIIRDITFLGVLSFVDPIRPEVLPALEKIEGYGVRVVMITGDLPGTAVSVGKALGWNIDESAVMTGAQLEQVTDDTLREMLPRLRIFARVTPADKVRVAQVYQSMGEVVAMTGDGVNDGPALKVANIGIALGSGSDVAKSIADLILIDDNFQTIVATISEGKQMLANIKKIFVYLMSNSLDVVILIGGSILAGIALPLTAVQIIWVNLFTGSLPAIAFAFDRQPATKGVEDSKIFFDRTVLFLVLGVGTVTSTSLFVLYYVLIQLGISLETAQSVLFLCFSSYILVISFCLRNLHAPVYTYSLIDNPYLIGGVCVGMLSILAAVYVPFFESIFDLTPISGYWVLFVIVWLIGIVFLVEGAKWFAQKYLSR